MAASINASNVNGLFSICSGRWVYLFLRGGDSSTRTLRPVTMFCLDSCTLEANEQEIDDGKQKGKKRAAKQEKPADHTILCSALSSDGHYLAVATVSKFLVLFQHDFEFFSRDDQETSKIIPSFHYRKLHKPCTAIYFATNSDSAEILCSDRSGSIYRITLADLTNSEEECDELLGHLSMVLDLSLSPNNRLLLTAERDEKIRVSRFPDAFVIEGYCLGHSSFVKTVHCLDNTFAVSAGGGSAICLWDYSSARLLFTSQKVCDSPIRKLRSFPMKEASKFFVIALPDECSQLQIFECDVTQSVLSLCKTIHAPDEKELFDFCVDQISGTVFIVGRTGICTFDLAGMMEGERTEMTRLELPEIGISFLGELANCRDRMPMADLAKVVAYGNIQNYQNQKEQKGKGKRKKSSSNHSE